MMRETRRYLSRVGHALANTSIASIIVHKNFQTRYDTLQQEFDDWKKKYDDLLSGKLGKAELAVNAAMDDRDAYAEFADQTLRLVERQGNFLREYFPKLDEAIGRIEKAAKREIPSSLVS